MALRSGLGLLINGADLISHQYGEQNVADIS